MKANHNKDKFGRGFSGYRYLKLGGRVQRRLCTVVGDRAFVHPGPPSGLRQRSREMARIVKPIELFKTPAEALGGNDIDLFVCHDERYEKLKARKLENGHYVNVLSNGRLGEVWGKAFENELDALEYCLGVLAESTVLLEAKALRLLNRQREIRGLRPMLPGSRNARKARSENKKRARIRA